MKRIKRICASCDKDLGNEERSRIEEQNGIGPPREYFCDRHCYGLLHDERETYAAVMPVLQKELHPCAT